MAFRGRGRGCGFGGGGGFRMAKQEPFELFPEIENFPDAKALTEEISLVVSNSKLQKFWNTSPYCIVDGQKTNFSGFIKTSSEYVPAELAKDVKQERRGKRRVQWNPNSDLKKFDIFEKLEKQYQGQDGQEKKENENEDEDEENVSEEDEEFSDDGDYNQNIDFDDDEDDFNMDDGNGGGGDDETY